MKSTQNTWFRLNWDRANESSSSTSVLMISLFWVLCVSERITSVDGFEPYQTWDWNVMAWALGCRKTRSRFNNNINIAQGGGEHTHFDLRLTRLYRTTVRTGKAAETEREERMLGRFLWSLGSCRWLHSITNGALDRKSSSRHSPPNGTSSPFREKNTQMPRSPSPTLQLLYEVLSQLCLPHTPHAHSLSVFSNNTF